MSPDELPSQPRKASWKRWIVVLAGVVAVITIALLAIPPKNEPVKVWFVRSTNELGVKKLVFEGTNGMTRSIRYEAYLILRPRGEKWPEEPFFPPQSVATPDVGPRETFTFSLKAPPKDTDWRAIWYFYDHHVPTRWEKAREVCWELLTDLHVYALAEAFDDWPPKKHYITSSELKE